MAIVVPEEMLGGLDEVKEALDQQTPPTLTLLVNAISTSENRRPFSEKHYTV